MIVSHICDNVKQCRYGVSHICYAVIMSDSNTPTDLTRKIGEILARKYDALEMSLRQAEDKTGLSRMTIKRMLNAETAIPLDKFETLARALGLIPWRVMRQAEDELEAQSNVLRFPATSRQENQREADAMLAEQRYAASQLQDGEEDAPQYPEWD